MQYTYHLAYQRKYYGHKVPVYSSQIIFPIPTAVVTAVWNLVFVIHMQFFIPSLYNVCIFQQYKVLFGMLRSQILCSLLQPAFFIQLACSLLKLH